MTTNRSQIVSLSVGQAGVQMSHACWELYCMEHGISPNGQIVSQAEVESNQERCDVLYYATPKNIQIPRAIIADLEPSVVDEIRTGAYRDLFDPTSMFSHFEDAANNYARGYYNMGRRLNHTVLRSIRRQSEMCDCLQGFLVTNGLGGGTGSGFLTSLLEGIADSHNKVPKVTVNIFPGPSMSTALVEPYNVGLSVSPSVELSDVNLTLDNEACFRICHTGLRLPRPTYSHINRLMAQVCSQITCFFRFRCPLNADLTQLQTNLVPYPRIHFPIISLAPVISPTDALRDNLRVRQLVCNLFSREGRLVTCDTLLGSYMSCNILFRGAVSPKEMNEAVQLVKKRPSFRLVDWSPTGFKIGLCSQPPVMLPGSGLAQTERCCLMVSNSTAIQQIWRSQEAKFERLFSKRSFVFWYIGEGMEESQFDEAAEEMRALIQDYCAVAEGEENNAADETENGDKAATSTSGNPNESNEEGAAANNGPVKDSTVQEEESFAEIEDMMNHMMYDSDAEKDNDFSCSPLTDN